jgi:hypothetical protein
MDAPNDCFKDTENYEKHKAAGSPLFNYTSISIIYIVHYLHCPHHLFPSTPSPPYFKKLQEVS